MRNWLTRLLHRPNLMSAEWLKERDRLAAHVDYQGVAIAWPIRKVLNDSPIWNAAKRTEDMRRRA